ncbi:DUF6517 family protein [Halostagnicola sp. A-GB9-2]|uniref:DUF6517 family protein n=1 Tax=Halostagnicola sp. A-GB9-2 TaxID=3048066 RepID=UPI0024BF54FA|nr:DUF6517 family protein [Halostagnicola sp. A-GB9-2]MDJ1432334.1 DUF6517 family protein [Halostagnicola sp. A-GB9-2]
MNRRSLLAGATVLGISSVAGCLGTIGMDEHEASPASVDESAREETGYEQSAVVEDTLEESVDLVITSEEVSVTNYVTEHEKSVSVGPLTLDDGGVFLVVSTPQVSILGQQFNPVEDMSAGEFVAEIEDNYDGMENVTPQGEETVTILDQETTQTRFTADATYDGSSVEVSIHISEAVETDDDLLVTVGVYPNELRDEEEPNVISLMESVSDVAPEGGDENGNESEDSENGDGGDEDEDEGILGI